MTRPTVLAICGGVAAVATALWIGWSQGGQAPAKDPAVSHSQPAARQEGGRHAQVPPSPARPADSGAEPPAQTGDAAPVGTGNVLSSPEAAVPSAANAGGEMIGAGPRVATAASVGGGWTNGAGGSGNSAGQGQAGFPMANAGTSARATAELSIPVPVGEAVPAVFYDNEARPAPQMRALDRIAREFNANITTPDGSPPSPEVWREAKEIADRRYITLFGFRKYNEISIAAAREALKEKKAAQAAAAQP